MALELDFRDTEALPPVAETREPVGAAELLEPPVLPGHLARERVVTC